MSFGALGRGVSAGAAFLPVPVRLALLLLVLGGGLVLIKHGGVQFYLSPVGLLPLWTVIPFVGILLSIALGPLIAPHFWHAHFPKVSAFWALLFAVPFLFWNPSEAIQEILHIYLMDYIPFIILLWGLFTISGGIFHVSLWTLLLASFLGRFARFFIVAVCIFFFGPSVKTLLEKYFEVLSLLFFVLLVGGFVLIQYLL